MRLGIALVFTLAACGSSGSSSSATDAGPSTSSGRAAGEACTTGDPCGPSLDCLVKDQAQFKAPLTGVCSPRTDACLEGCDCKPAECTKSGVCFATGSGSTQIRTFGCFTSLRAENEACELGQGCADGLFCLLPAAGQPGSCKPIPAACAGTTFCSGCAEMKDQCLPNAWQSCKDTADVYFVECKPPT